MAIVVSAILEKSDFKSQYNIRRVSVYRKRGKGRQCGLQKKVISALCLQKAQNEYLRTPNMQI